MKFYPVKQALALLCLSLPIAVHAASASKATTVPAASPSWLMQQINKSPEVIAAKESMNAVFSLTEGQKKALYNPEIATNFAREGKFNNFTVGINQTIDLWNKREQRSTQADLQLAQAKQIFHYLIQEKTAQALQALVNYQNAQMQAKIANEKEQQLGTLLNLVAKRQQAGDVSQVDAELTFLSLSQTLNTSAQTQALLAKTKAKIIELLPDWTNSQYILPGQGIAIERYKIDELTSKQWLNQHPLVQVAKLQWQISKSRATQALLATKADPTLGINAGKTDGDNALGLSFSMPLNVRNNFSSEARAANQQAIAAESQLQAVLRKQKFAIQATTDSVLAYKKHYQRWQKLMQGRDKRIADLLQKQWQSGDINTTEYLLALQQRAEGLLAGIELQSQFKLSQIDWLLSIGQVDIALKSLLIK